MIKAHLFSENTHDGRACVWVREREREKAGCHLCWITLWNLLFVPRVRAKPSIALSPSHSPHTLISAARTSTLDSAHSTILPPPGTFSPLSTCQTLQHLGRCLSHSKTHCTCFQLHIPVSFLSYTWCNFYPLQPFSIKSQSHWQI